MTQPEAVPVPETETPNEKPIYHLADNEFYQFFARQVSKNESFVIKCYRVSRQKNKTYKTWLEDFFDEIPEEEDLAKNYGGGQYWLVGYDDNNRKLEKTIWIDEIWTKRLDESRRIPEGRPAAPGERNDPFEFFSKVMDSFVKPMMQLQNQNNNNSRNSVDNMGENMGKVYEKIAIGMASGLSKIQSAVIDKQLNKMDEPAQLPHEPVSEKMAFVRELIGVAKEFGDKLLNANGMKEQLYKAVIEDDERFQKAKEDPDIYDALYTEAVNDPEIGKEKADKLFRKLGFETE